MILFSAHYFLTKTNSVPVSINTFLGDLSTFSQNFLNSLRKTLDFLFLVQTPVEIIRLVYANLRQWIRKIVGGQPQGERGQTSKIQAPKAPIFIEKIAFNAFWAFLVIKHQFDTKQEQHHQFRYFLSQISDFVALSEKLQNVSKKMWILTLFGNQGLQKRHDGAPKSENLGKIELQKSPPLITLYWIYPKMVENTFF